MIGELGLHTVCESAKCPNLGECWANRTATLMILGDVCTRSCGFCAVTTGRPIGLDAEEPERVVEAVRRMGLRHVVITSVNRDDLPDGGAAIFAETIRRVREEMRECALEVLIPDFKGDWEALDVVNAQLPDILNHNIETVPRLYTRVRPQAKYMRSLELIQRSKEAGLVTKSGLMVGLGERTDELHAVMSDLAQHGCDIMTIGQYMRPTVRHLPVERYYSPDEFDELRVAAVSRGLSHVESGVFVRSSYHAWDQAEAVRRKPSAED
jgi:lipoic acid synthetase